jgi:hypothetical protein
MSVTTTISPEGAEQLRRAQRALDTATHDEAAAFSIWNEMRLRKALAASAVMAMQERIIDAMRTV